MTKKIYIAGKVTGERPEDCAAKFEAAENIIRAKGYKVVNPFKLINPKDTYQRMRANWVLELKLCDGIFLLPCAAESICAEKELQIAIINNLDIYSEYHEL